MKTKIIELSDGNAIEHCATLREAIEAASGWYDYIWDNGDGPGTRPELHTEGIDDLDDLVGRIGSWEEEIAEALGYSDWAGHGNYWVSAAAEAGLNLRVKTRNNEV